MMFFDAATLVISLYLAFVFRLETFFIYSLEGIFNSFWIFIVLPLMFILLFIRIGLYRTVIQHVGVKVITTTFQASTISCVFFGFLYYYFFKDNTETLPRSILPIFWFISNVLIITSRFILKGILYSWDSYVNHRKQTIIYGAGNAGIQLVESLKKSSDYAPIAFVDDSKEKQGTILNFLQVFSYQNINYLIDKKKAKVLLFAIPSLSFKERSLILKKLTKLPIEVKVLPSVDNIVNGIVSLDHIKHVDVRDILGRNTVPPKKELLEKNIYDKNVLITGAGGSIGVELSRQVLRLQPKTLVLFDNSEFSLYTIHMELNQLNSKVEIVPVLSTITNFYHLKKIIKRYSIDTIYHAAAYKHVPMLEMNIVSGVYNNVIGTYNLAKVSDELGVECMVLISSDKAVRPTNVMGASKRMSELVLQAYSQQSNCCFSMVRFGNVLDSAGSVVPLFREQIQKGGPLTVTHKDITRYFMSIPEASELVLQAGAMAKGGDVFVLDMGEPIKIIDLAYKMIHLSGLTPIDTANPDGDIEIHFTGLRPGEKLYEELIIGSDIVPSKHPSIMQAIEKKLDKHIVWECIKMIKSARENQDENIIKDLLLKHVEGYISNITEKK